MMSILKKTLAIVFFIAAGLLNAEDLVKNKKFKTPKVWNEHKIMGKDFWIILSQWYFNHPGLKIQDSYSELAKMSVFKNSGLHWKGGIKMKDVPQNNFAVKDFFNVSQNPWWNALESKKKQNVPLFLTLGGSRSIYYLKNHYNHDEEKFQAWKKTHPNLQGFLQSEWDNEMVNYVYYPRNKKFHGDRYPQPNDRYEALANAQKAHGNSRKFHFNEPATEISFLRAGWCMDHISAALGCKALWLETTNTSCGIWSYRWQISSFFTRGASRQFNVPWGWYIANFYNGYNSKGKWHNNANINFIANRWGGGADWGISQSLYKRCLYFAWLSGANFIEPENWGVAFTKYNEKKQKHELSKFGKDFSDFYDFTQKTPNRGIPYTPVAILTPFAQCYPNYGGKSWSRFEYEPGDYMIDAFMFSIVPGYNRVELMKKGVEGCMFNSKIGGIFDVLTPDAPNKKGLDKVLAAYEIAILTGTYRPDADMVAALKNYVRNGGTLMLNTAQLDFGSDFTGVKKSEKTADVKFDGEKYVADLVKLHGATPVLKADGIVLATSNNFGKGKVIMTTPQYMTVPLDENSLRQGPTGEGKFSFIRYFLKKIQNETLPLKIKGDIQFGVNKIDSGWLLYLINNKGICKFTDTAQTVVPEGRAKVHVEFTDYGKFTDFITGEALGSGKGFDVTVEPGDLRIIKILNTK